MLVQAGLLAELLAGLKAAEEGRRNGVLALWAQGHGCRTWRCPPVVIASHTLQVLVRKQAQNLLDAFQVNVVL